MKTIKINLFLSLAAVPLLFSACTPTASTGATGSLSVPAPVDNELANIPTGKPDPQARKNMVISPYSPYNLIDVKGYRSGEVVGDPSTAKRDATGKVIESTSKYFLVP